MNPATLIDKVMRLRAETKADTLDYDQIVTEPLNTEDLTRLWLLIGEWQTSLNTLEKAVSVQLVQLLDDAIEVDGFLVYAKLGRTDEKCIDSSKFLAWLAEHPEQVPAVVSPNTVKKASLPPAVRDTFFEKTRVVKPEAVPQPAAVPLEVLEDNKQRKALA